MPSGFFRLVAVVLLAFAIPAQGMAAVTAGQCMAFGHHDAAGGQDHDHGQDGAEGHDHASQAQGDDEKSAHCGPCTACCASASITGPSGISIPSSATNVSYFFFQFPSLGFQPNGPERPPLAL